MCNLNKENSCTTKIDMKAEKTILNIFITCIRRSMIRLNYDNKCELHWTTYERTKQLLNIA